MFISPHVVPPPSCGVLSYIRMVSIQLKTQDTYSYVWSPSLCSFLFSDILPWKFWLICDSELSVFNSAMLRSSSWALTLWTSGLQITSRCPLQCFWASLVAQPVKNPPAMRETWVPSLGWEDPLEKGKATHSSILAWRIPWTVIVHGVTKSQTRLRDFHTFRVVERPTLFSLPPAPRGHSPLVPLSWCPQTAVSYFLQFSGCLWQDSKSRPSYLLMVGT